MQTHFLKKQLGRYDKFAIPLEGAIYNSLPGDRLVTADELFRLVEEHCRRDGDRPPTRKGFQGCLDGMCEKGFVHLIHGARIERWVATL